MISIDSLASITRLEKENAQLKTEIKKLKSEIEVLKTERDKYKKKCRRLEKDSD